MCKLFPEEAIEQEQGESRAKQGNEEDRFESIISQYNFSNEFIALLREMMKIDRNERIKIEDLLEAYDLIVANEESFIKENGAKNVVAEIVNKPNQTQAPINKEIL